MTTTRMNAVIDETGIGIAMGVGTETATANDENAAKNVHAEMLTVT